MKIRIYKHYRTGRKNGGQRYWVGRKLNKRNFGSLSKEDIHLKGIKARKLANFERYLSTAELTEDELIEFPKDIKEKVALGIPISKHEYRFVPKNIRRRWGIYLEGDLPKNIEEKITQQGYSNL